MRSGGYTWLLALLLAALAAGCRGDRCDTPFGLGGELDLLMPEFSRLYASPGSTLIINRGHKGILVNCIALDEYVAYECACPNDHDERLQPDDETRAMTLRCSRCGAQFDTYFGQPMNDLSRCALYRYNTAFDGRYLYIN